MTSILWLCFAVLLVGCSQKQITPESPGARATAPATATSKGPPVSAAPGAEGTPGEWSGLVRAGMMAIGGETTGMTLTTESAVYELRATGETLGALAELSGQHVTVRGRLREVAGVEVRTRRIVEVLEIVRR